jgi:ABC-2 type transport system permease protein
MPTRIWMIGRNTFTEAIRQPIFVVMLGVGLLALVLNPALSAYTMDDDNKLLIDLGLSTLLMGGLAMAALVATGVLSREIENKTVLTVISKPIGRPTFVVGKFIGVAAAITMATWIWAITFLLTVRHKVLSGAGDPYDMPVIVFGTAALAIAMVIAVWGNYFYNWVFSATFSVVLAVTLPLAYLMVLMINRDWQFQSITTEFLHWNETNYGEKAKDLGQIMLGVVMVIQAVWVLCAVAVAASTRLKQVMTLVISAGVLMLGLGSDHLLGRFVDSSLAARIGYAIAPNMQVHWLADALTQGHAISLPYLGFATLYTAFYIAAVLCLGVALFQTRETG